MEDVRGGEEGRGGEGRRGRRRRVKVAARRSVVVAGAELPEGPLFAAA